MLFLVVVSQTEIQLSINTVPTGWLPRCLSGKELACRFICVQGLPSGTQPEQDTSLVAQEGDAGDLGSIPGLGSSPGGGNGNPLQYSCLENPMDRRAWRAPVHGAAKSWTCLSIQKEHCSHCCQCSCYNTPLSHRLRNQKIPKVYSVR